MSWLRRWRLNRKWRAHVRAVKNTPDPWFGWSPMHELEAQVQKEMEGE